MTTFAQLAKGGKVGEDITLEAGQAGRELFVELLGPDAEPRMPYKQDPLPPTRRSPCSTRWVARAPSTTARPTTRTGRFCSARPRTTDDPRGVPHDRPRHGRSIQPGRPADRASGYHELTTWKTADGSARPTASRACPSGPMTSPTAPTASGWPPPAATPACTASPGSGRSRPAAAQAGARSGRERRTSSFAVAFSPDGSKLATAGADRAVRVYETATGKVLVQIEDHADWIFDIAFSPDGKLLASASRDKTSKVFDIEKKESLVTFTGHGQTVYAVAFTRRRQIGDHRPARTSSSASGRSTARPSRSGRSPASAVRLHDGPDARRQDSRRQRRRTRSSACSTPATARPCGSSKATTDWVYALSISPDGKTIASGSWNGEVRLWNLEDGKPFRTIIAAPGYKAPGAQAAR